MLKKWLSYWLVILIAMQSFSAIADSHQTHQSGEQHLSFEHEHAQTPVESIQPLSLKKSTELPSDGLDCHHCCHCHLHLNYLPTASLGLLLPHNSSELSRYNTTALVGLLSSLFRPPKFNSTIV